MIPTTCPSSAKDCSMQEQHLLSASKHIRMASHPRTQCKWESNRKVRLKHVPTPGCILGPPTASLSTAFLQQEAQEFSVHQASCYRLESSSNRARRHSPEKSMPFRTDQQDQVTNWVHWQAGCCQWPTLEPRLWHSVALYSTKPDHTRITKRHSSTRRHKSVCHLPLRGQLPNRENSNV